MLKAIETVYKGYKFRSRLEARWAVFFDYLEIKYEYEKEGFELENGDRYLPDFYLPEVANGRGCWVEIKPLTEKEYGQVGGEIPDDEWPTGTAKMAYLLNGIAGGVIIYGNPYPGEYKIFKFNSDGIAYERWMEFRMCLDCGLLTIGDLDRYDAFWNQWGNFKRPCRYCYVPISPAIHDHLMRAYEAARQARFEHGDKSSSFMDAIARGINEQKRRSRGL